MIRQTCLAQDLEALAKDESYRKGLFEETNAILKGEKPKGKQNDKLVIVREDGTRVTYEK